MKKAPMNRIKHGLQALVLLLILFSLLSCRPVKPDLAGSEWELISLKGEELIEGTTITLSITEDYLGGEMGCNGYGGSPDMGSYRAKKSGAFELEPPFAVTVQLCTEPEGIMKQEAAYIEALQAATHFKITGDRLALENQAGEGILVYQRK